MKDIRKYIFNKYFNPKEHKKIIDEALRLSVEDQKKLSKKFNRLVINYENIARNVVIRD